MTLVAPKKLPPKHKIRTGRHQKHNKHFTKAYWPYLPMLLIVGLGFPLNGVVNNNRHSVLGYATSMSVSALLDDTNTQRVSAGEKALHLNSKLDTAAQNKANDMAAKDYWSHDTPTGQTPWSFIIAAGYSYQTAGENLAYGFATADDTVTGWMNSPEHRANILNLSYTDVGFGYINIPDYQNSGPQTLVVAMYASPLKSTSTVSNTTTQQASPPVNTAELKQSAPVKTATTDKKSVVKKQPVSKIGDTVKPATLPVKAPAKAELPEQRISKIQLVAGGEAAWSLGVTFLIIVVLAILLIVRHGIMWHRWLKRGEKFIIRHPLYDIVAVALVVLGIVLSHTAGFIR